MNTGTVAGRIKVLMCTGDELGSLEDQEECWRLLVRARVLGQWAYHREVEPMGATKQWTITHVPSGGGITCVRTRAQAEELVRRLQPVPRFQDEEDGKRSGALGEAIKIVREFHSLID